MFRQRVSTGALCGAVTVLTLAVQSPVVAQSNTSNGDGNASQTNSTGNITAYGLMLYWGLPFGEGGGVQRWLGAVRFDTPITYNVFDSLTALCRVTIKCEPPA